MYTHNNGANANDTTVKETVRLPAKYADDYNRLEGENASLRAEIIRKDTELRACSELAKLFDTGDVKYGLIAYRIYRHAEAGLGEKDGM